MTQINFLFLLATISHDRSDEQNDITSLNVSLNVMKTMQALGKKKEPDIVVTIGQKSTQYIDGKDPQATIIFNTHNGSNTLVEDSIPGILV